MNQIAQESPRNQSDVSQNGVRSFMIKESELDDVQRKLYKEKLILTRLSLAVQGPVRLLLLFGKQKSLLKQSMLLFLLSHIQKHLYLLLKLPVKP